jgi:hypothetical protein
MYNFLYMYVGCSGDNRVCMGCSGVMYVGCSGKCMYVGCSGKVYVGSGVYIYGLQWAQSCMYVGCSKVNHVHRTRFSGQEQVRTG